MRSAKIQMNKKQRATLLITALLIFLFLFVEILADRRDNLSRVIQWILLFGVPGWLLHLAFKDKHEK